MRTTSLIALFFIVACTPAEKEVHTTSVDVEQSDIRSLLEDIDAITEGPLPIAAMLELAVSTPMDEELQERFDVNFGGHKEEIQYHVWREQVDWVHLYFSTTSTELIEAIEEIAAEHQRDTG